MSHSIRELEAIKLRVHHQSLSRCVSDSTYIYFVIVDYMRMNVFHGFVTSRCGGSSSKGGSKYPSHQGSGGGSGDTSDGNQRGGVPCSSRQNQPQLLVAEKANSRNKGVSNLSSVKQTVNRCNRQSDAGEGTHGNSLEELQLEMLLMVVVRTKVLGNGKMAEV